MTATSGEPHLLLEDDEPRARGPGDDRVRRREPDDPAADDADVVHRRDVYYPGRPDTIDGSGKLKRFVPLA